MITVDIVEKVIKRRIRRLLGWILYWIATLLLTVHLFAADRNVLAGIMLGLQNFGFYRVIYTHGGLYTARKIKKSLEESDDGGREENV